MFHFYFNLEISVFFNAPYPKINLKKSHRCSEMGSLGGRTVLTFLCPADDRKLRADILLPHIQE